MFILYPISSFALATLYCDNLKQGLVIKSTGSWYSVRENDGNVINCRIKGKFRLKDIKTTNPISVGDVVNFEIVDEDGGVIKSIEERKNYIIRKSVNLSKRAHIIASNIDIAFLVVTLYEPKTFVSFIDRFLISAEAYRIPAVIIFNKVDILSEEQTQELDELINIYEKIGYPCIKTSVTENYNLDKVKELMKDKVTVFSGHSGVGKSSLINALDNNISIKTSEISEQHKQGKHTTTFAEMHELNFGGFIIDTPGIRGLGLVDIEKEELSHYYPEMRAIMNECKFNNCVHINEPNCAVKEAVKTGEISESRYNTYYNIYNEVDDNGFRENLYGPK